MGVTKNRTAFVGCLVPVQMIIKVKLPTGQELSYSLTDERYSGIVTLGQLKQQIREDEGVPLELQQLRLTHTREGLTNTDDALTSIYKDTNFLGGELRLDMLYDLTGAANSHCDCGDFQPAVKILCLQCSCTGEWKNWQLCCAKCSCSIQ